MEKKTNLGKLIIILVAVWVVCLAFLISISGPTGFSTDFCRGMMFLPIQDVPTFCLVDSAKEIVGK